MLVPLLSHFLILRYSKIFIFLLFPLLTVLPIQAKETTSVLKFTSLSTEQGLSQSFAYNITQDNSGFIWIATQDGLNKYDGKNITQYRHNPTIANSLSDNFIRKVFLDRAGNLWVGTYDSGLNKLNVNAEFFGHTKATSLDKKKKNNKE